MKPWIAHAIASNGPSLDEESDYSGRGMFGVATSAVTGSLPAFIAASASAARELADEQLAEEFLDALASVRIDGMGRESVFY
jgi:hypothetical protein